MKKVAILTINDDMNLGNRLQNYAVQEIIKKYNCKVETISNQENIYGIKFIKKLVINYIKLILNVKNNTKRYNNFMKFNRNINYSIYRIDKGHIPKKLCNKYDYFFTGSDQVWNPNFRSRSDIDFLTFAPKEKRNSISASFGVSEIPEEKKEYYKRNLLDIKNISVREDIGKEIVEELTGRKDIEVLVDPTMALNEEEWNAVTKKPKQSIPKKYILNYFIGERSEERKKEIQRIASSNDCQIINILDPKDPFYVSGPSEFLYLEKNAFCVFTDSFHACVFSILFNRPFIVFEREDNIKKMNSRIETLINKFQLQDRYYIDKIQESQLKVDYSNVYKILEDERKKMKSFLDRIFRIG